MLLRPVKVNVNVRWEPDTYALSRQVESILSKY